MCVCMFLHLTQYILILISRAADKREDAPCYREDEAELDICSLFLTLA